MLGSGYNPVVPLEISKISKIIKNLKNTRFAFE